MFWIRLGSAVLTGLALLVLAAALRIAAGPIALGPAAPWVEARLAELGGTTRITLRDAALEWNRRENALDLHLSGVELAQADGRPVLDLPEARLAIHVPSLMQGEVRPIRLEIEGLALRLVREADGRIDLGLDPGQEPDAAEGPDLLRELAEGDGTGPLARLRLVRLSGARLLVEDRRSGRTLTAPEADFVFRRLAHGLEAEVSGVLEVGEARLQARLSALMPAGSPQAMVRAFAWDVQPQSFAGLAPELAFLSGLRLPVNLQLGFRAELDRLASPIDFVLETKAGELALAELGPAPLRVDRIVAHGSIAQDLKRARLEAAAIDLPGLRLRIAGEAVRRSAEAPDIDLVLNADPFSVDTLKRTWPAAVGKDARDWIVQNILAGQLRDTRARVRLTGDELAGKAPLPADAVTLEWKYEGLQIRYFRPLPVLTQVAGTARMSAQRLDLAVGAGRVGELVVRNGTVAVTGLDKKDQFAEIQVAADSPLPYLLGVLDREPLGFVRRFGFEPEAAKGAAAVDAQFRIPLAKNLSVDSLGVTASALVRDFAYPLVMDRFRLERGELNIRVDRQQLSARGKLAMNGVPVQLIWVEKFSGPLASRYDITGVLDEGGRAALGFPTDPYIRGTLGADAAIEVGRSGDVKADVALDLTDAAVAFQPLRWEKPPRLPGTARIGVQAPSGKPIRLDKVEVKTADLALSGSAVIGPGGQRRYDVASLKQGGTDLHGSVVVAEDGSTIVELAGASADLRPYLKDLDSEHGPADKDKAKPEPPTTFRFDIESVALSDEVAVRRATGWGIQRDGKLAELQATGRLGETGTLQASMRPAPNGRRLEVSSAEAGGVIKGLGITDDIVGGQLTMHADIVDTGPGEAPTKGLVRIEDFRLLRAPAIAKVLSIAAISGIGELLSGEGVHFVRANLPFTMTGSRIRLEEARAWGPSMGFTAEGTIDRASDTMVLTGTLVPAYAVNSVLGNIPILGQLLVGRKGEGIFGITYRMSGPLSDPTVEINPLSALTPGFLRRIFEFGESMPSKDPEGTVGPKGSGTP